MPSDKSVSSLNIHHIGRYVLSNQQPLSKGLSQVVISLFISIQLQFIPIYEKSANKPCHSPCQGLAPPACRKLSNDLFVFLQWAARMVAVKIGTTFFASRVHMKELLLLVESEKLIFSYTFVISSAGK